jgi:hypothetical protein
LVLAWASKREHYDAYSTPLMITQSPFIALRLLAHIYKSPFTSLNCFKAAFAFLHFETFKTEFTSVCFEGNPTALRG